MGTHAQPITTSFGKHSPHPHCEQNQKAIGEVLPIGNHFGYSFRKQVLSVGWGWVNNQ